MHIRHPAPLLVLAALFAMPSAWAEPAPLPTGPLPPGQAEVDAGEKARDAKQCPAALAAFEKAAALANTDAMVDLGEMHEKGWGVHRDMAKAVAWYDKAAKLGDPYAKYKIKCDLAGREAKWKELLKKAEAGDGEALRQVGDAFFFGAPLADQDEVEAAKWYEKSAAKGDAQAACNLGLMSEYGFGVKQDDKAAMAWYETAQAAGSAEALYRIGGLYLRGDGVAQDAAKAVDFFTKSAEAGSVLGMRMLALCHREGMGVAKDKDAAKQWKEKAEAVDGIKEMRLMVDLRAYGMLPGGPQAGPAAAPVLEARAKAGDVAAMNYLGQESVSAKSRYGVARDYQQGLAWMGKAAKRGSREAANTLAIILTGCNPSSWSNYGDLLDFRQSCLLWQKASRGPDGLAANGMRQSILCNLVGMSQAKTGLPLTLEHALGWLQAGGDFSLVNGQQDLPYVHGCQGGLAQPEAMELCARLARHGDALAMVDLGVAYAQGDGVAKDGARSHRWFVRAATANAASAGRVGEWYSMGCGLPHDEKLAAQWLKVGAAAGNRRAMFLLGRAHYLGEGVPKDVPKALAWYDKVAQASKATYHLDTQGYNDDMARLMTAYARGQDAPLDLGKMNQMAVRDPLTSSHFLMGYAHHRGLGVPKDYAKAAKEYATPGLGTTLAWLGHIEMHYKGQGAPPDRKKVAVTMDVTERGQDHICSPLLEHDFAVMALNGVCVPRDGVRAMDHFLRAVYYGNGESESSLALMFDDDVGDPKEKAGKRDALLAAARAGDKDAMHRLGRMHWLGQGVPIDRTQAERWFCRAAAAGHAEATCALGSLCVDRTTLHDSAHTLQRRLAIPWFQKAAALSCPRAMFCLGYAHEQGLGISKDLEKSVAWYAKGAAAGDTYAMIAIAELARNGAVGDADDAKALGWYTAAAAKGNLLAMRVLADSYRTGGWTGADGKRAFAWYEKAAAKGDPEAMFRLGLALRHGTAVAVDEVKAAVWYAKAANLGHSGAMRNLGSACRDGKGVKEDAQTAWAWFELAARDLAKNAEGYRDAVEGQMTEAQLKEAKAAADALGKKIWPDR